MTDLRTIVREGSERVVQTRRDLHRIPETGFQEHETAAYVDARLRELGLEVRMGVAGTGVVGLLRGGAPGRTVMLRADMDALPVTEATGLPFASTRAGRMHACGHDGHMAMVLGAAEALARVREGLVGNVKLVFQPAEEGPGGAEPLIAAGVLEDPAVDACVGCHLWPGLPAGQVGVRPGPLMAAMGRFDLRILGRGGHGAMPHLCVDALEVGTQVVGALQRLVSRKTNPLSPAVVTVGSFHAGTARNIIPGEALLSGTTRCFDPEVRRTWRERLDQVVRGVCDSMGASYELTFAEGYPPVVNDPEVAGVVARCAAQVVGAENVVEAERSLGGEDMAFYLERVPGCFFFLGARREGVGPLHSPFFDFPETVLTIGVEVLCRAALDLLGGTGGAAEGGLPPAREDVGRGRP